jgi:hypothetical protein
MATYDELLQAAENATLRNRIRVACVIAAEAVRTEVGTTTNHANRLIWAKAVFANPTAEADRMLWAVLAQNKAATLAQITGATDSAIQTAVSAAVDVFATA